MVVEDRSDNAREEHQRSVGNSEADEQRQLQTDGWIPGADSRPHLKKNGDAVEPKVKNRKEYRRPNAPRIPGHAHAREQTRDRFLDRACDGDGATQRFQFAFHACTCCAGSCLSRLLGEALALGRQERRTKCGAPANKLLRAIDAILARIANKRTLLYETVRAMSESE